MTGSSDPKIKQIQNNPKIEFCLLISKGNDNGYIRGSGKANIIQDKETKKRLANHANHFSNYFKGPEDPNYALLEIEIKEIEYLEIGAMLAEKYQF